MTKVLFMQNCFCPDRNQFERLKRSILSLTEYGSKIRSNNYYEYVLSGYVADEFKKELDDIFFELDPGYFNRIYLWLHPTNLGKGKVCNFIVDKYGEDMDYVFFFDNDIVFKPCTEDIVNILITQQKEMDAIGGIEYPVISCNFEEHQVHQIDAMDQGFTTKDGRLVKCSTGRFGCVGGGCWLVKKSHWDELGGYCSDTIYGKDDGKFYLDTIVMKKMVALSMEVWVIHPSDEDQTYNLFKADTNVNRVRNMNYKELGIDSDNFWKSR